MTVFGSGPAFDSMDAVQRWAFDRLLRSDLYAAPRGLPTRELLGQTFTLLDPRARMIKAPARRWSLPLAIGEFCWHASASIDVDALAYYAPRWRAFAQDGHTIRQSCYGHRIFGQNESGFSCWDALIALLRQDPESRRAIIDLSGTDRLSSAAVDVSCTSTFQVLIRNGRLHVIVQMRSNDAVWGLPYDVFLFTMLQEMLTELLGLELGTYMHGAGSLHLYERHAELAHRVLADPPPAPMAMPRMLPVSELDRFLMAERAIRSGETPQPLSGYWDSLAQPLRDFARRESTGSLSPAQN
jgi:thymidylate synthase